MFPGKKKQGRKALKWNLFIAAAAARFTSHAANANVGHLGEKMASPGVEDDGVKLSGLQ